MSDEELIEKINEQLKKGNMFSKALEKLGVLLDMLKKYNSRKLFVVMLFYAAMAVICYYLYRTQPGLLKEALPDMAIGSMIVSCAYIVGQSFVDASKGRKSE